MSVNRFELEIYNNILGSIAEEMGTVLVKAAFSPNIKERRDLSCAIFNSSGEMIAQAAHIPVHLGSMAFSVHSILNEEINDEDVFVINDPFRGGTHLPDITCIAPVFVNGRHEFFVVARAHHADIGGKTPGSMPLSTSIHDEGIIIPPSKLYQKGSLNEPLMKEILDSTRNPVEREGDFTAQVASLRTGKKRLLETISKYSLEKIKDASSSLLDYSELIMKSVLRDIPCGVYNFSDFLDDDGAGTELIPLNVQITIEEEYAFIDFRGSSPRVRGCMNAPISVTTSAVLYAFQCLAPAELPLNSGPLRTLEIIVDEDSILNAAYPDAVVGGNVETSQRVVDIVFGALAEAIPEKLQAASCGSMNNITFGGTDPDSGRAFAYYETVAGGMGASYGKDGESAVQSHMTNTLNTPVETIEREMPVMIKSYSIRKDSGGSGRYRGGNGIVREYLFLTDTEFSIVTERRTTAPYGICGGGNGVPGKNILIRNNVQTDLPSKISLKVNSGDILRIETPGGGGWGKPEDASDSRKSQNQ